MQGGELFQEVQEFDEWQQDQPSSLGSTSIFGATNFGRTSSGLNQPTYAQQKPEKPAKSIFGSQQPLSTAPKSIFGGSQVFFGSAANVAPTFRTTTSSSLGSRATPTFDNTATSLFDD